MDGYPAGSSKLSNNKTMVSWKIFIETVINNFKIEGFDFNHISQINITIKSNKMDMTYDFYMKHNMEATEWKLNKLINKDKKLINKLPRK